MNSRPIPRLAGLAGLLGLTACAGALPRAQTTVYANGVYAFDERAMGLTTDLSGHLRIVGDSIEMLDVSPPCVENTLPPTAGRSQSFRCGLFSVYASHETGRWQFDYTTTKTVQSETESCIAYKTTEAGERRCTQTVTERRERTVPVTGTLRLVVVDTTPPTLPGVP
jgi:hypothetical protein